MACKRCDGNGTWGRSPLCFDCLDSAELFVTAEGVQVSPRRAGQRLYAGRYRYRAVKCGKDCSTCPHGFYVYLCWRVDGKARERYLGRAGEQGDAYETPYLAA